MNRKFLKVGPHFISPEEIIALVYSDGTIDVQVIGIGIDASSMRQRVEAESYMLIMRGGVKINLDKEIGDRLRDTLALSVADHPDGPMPA